ncbi:MAG TPA: hypothetical protein VE868_03230, partial [Balneolaceae bacterium]|nr:hypothetical protein [Balneolaceae bacterium]
MKTLYTASSFVFDNQFYRVLGSTSFIVFFTAYLFILPATYTSGHIGLISLHYLTWQDGIIAFVISLLMGMLLPFIIFSYRMGGSAHNASTAGGLFASIITPFLCC